MAEVIPFMVAANDPALTSEMVAFPGNAGNINAYLSRPKSGGKLGTVIVIHENRGLVDHIQDVARRFAKDGFAALAVDLLS
ncbi:MAG: dienelactone hydrolase family protein, partial [Deltaproteobacteria bacterium]|nr:dienelactone hydrolase family protein [Deltaproteobacteria bacterium]